MKESRQWLTAALAWAQLMLTQGRAVPRGGKDCAALQVDLPAASVCCPQRFGLVSGLSLQPGLGLWLVTTAFQCPKRCTPGSRTVGVISKCQEGMG